MKIACVGIVLLQLAAVGAAQAQTFDDVQVQVKGYTTAAKGPDETSVGFYTGPAEIGKPHSSVFSMKGCGILGVSGERGAALHEGATVVWKVEVTPIRVVDRAVTFRLRWARTVDQNTKGIVPPSEDLELTMRPGQSRWIDAVSVMAATDALRSNAPCKVSAASLRVSVDAFPDEELDRRLVAADLWLVERSADRSERTLLQAVRGLPNRPIPFYFDSITEGAVALDIHGHLLARPESGALEIALKTRSRWGPSPVDWRKVSQSASRWIESTIVVKPEEIVEVRLPTLGETAGAFGTRTFSIRIRARQLR